jgi:hypothetical protein
MPFLPLCCCQVTNPSAKAGSLRHVVDATPQPATCSKHQLPLLLLLLPLCCCQLAKNISQGRRLVLDITSHSQPHAESIICHCCCCCCCCCCQVTTTSAKAGGFEARFYHKVYAEEFGNVRGHFGPINTVAFAPDGRSFTTGGAP